MPVPLHALHGARPVPLQVGQSTFLSPLHVGQTVVFSPLHVPQVTCFSLTGNSCLSPIITFGGDGLGLVCNCTFLSRVTSFVSVVCLSSILLPSEKAATCFVSPVSFAPFMMLGEWKYLAARDFNICLFQWDTISFPGV
jgi:hypothetical protein